MQRRQSKIVFILLVGFSMTGLGIFLTKSVFEKFQAVDQAIKDTATFNSKAPANPRKLVWSGEVFLISELFDNQICSGIAQCDCCGTDLFFLDESQFAMISRCLFNDSYFSGTYQMLNDNLILNFTGKSVVELINESTNEVNYKTDTLEIKPIEFAVGWCREKILLQNPQLNGLKYGTPYDSWNATKLTKELTANLAWQLLAK